LAVLTVALLGFTATARPIRVGDAEAKDFLNAKE
jgi:hypothetical protein